MSGSDRGDGVRVMNAIARKDRMMDDRSWVEAEALPLENPDPMDAAKAKTDPLDKKDGAREPVVTQGSSGPDGTIGGDTGYAEAHPDGKQSE
jgi:hypothetical protein